MDKRFESFNPARIKKYFVESVIILLSEFEVKKKCLKIWSYRVVRAYSAFSSKKVRNNKNTFLRFSSPDEEVSESEPDDLLDEDESEI